MEQLNLRHLYYFWVMKMMFGLMQVITAIKAEVQSLHRLSTVLPQLH